MSEGQIVAIIWGPVAIVFGVCFVRFRVRLSRVAVIARDSRQTPAVLAAGGVFFIVIGAAVLVAGLTGVLR